MISGRGLGHTGGTLDKLEAIPGYTTQPEIDAASARGARGRLRHHRPDRRSRAGRPAPLRHPRRHRDGRDRSPLITASILSKKLAGGLHALVMDVKFGSGAFMPTREQARGSGAQHRRCRQRRRACRRRRCSPTWASAWATPPATRSRWPRASPCCKRRAGAPAAARGDAGAVRRDAGAGRARGGCRRRPARRRRPWPRALRRSASPRMVPAWAARPTFIERHAGPSAAAPLVRPVHPPHAGRVQAVDARALGLAVVELGGGRRHAEPCGRPRVGLTEVRGIGDGSGRTAPLALDPGARRSGGRGCGTNGCAMPISRDPSRPGRRRVRSTSGLPDGNAQRHARDLRAAAAGRHSSLESHGTRNVTGSTSGAKRCV